MGAKVATTSSPTNLSTKPSWIDDRLRRDVVEAIEDRPIRTGRHALGHAGRATDIGEQQGQFDLGTAVMLGDEVEARAAPVRVVVRGALADHPHHGRRCAGEWRGAEAAAWPVRQEPEDAAIPALVRAADRQEVVPEGVIGRIGSWLLNAHAGRPPPRT
jgi:hypothetical protein